MKTAFLVIGPESSGTRMLTEYLIKCAGAFGDWGHYQSLDRHLTFDLLKDTTSVVWRRSLPHGFQWPEVSQLKCFLSAKGFSVVIIGMTRNMEACVDSAFRHRHIGSYRTGLDNYHRASAIVNRHAQLIVNYERFCTEQGYRAEVLHLLNIKVPAIEPIEFKQPKS